MNTTAIVDCRAGSLEKPISLYCSVDFVDCRAGSLEIVGSKQTLL